MLSNAKKHRLNKTILRGYRLNGRKLPWRNTTDPYKILVSEVMLQQTQVSRVLSKYRQFLRQFPTLRSLARAKQRDVIIAWQGMGYNNRAVRLHRLARTVTSQDRKTIRGDYESLLNLPGIGKYTANAILSFAFRRDVPVVDTNVRRVLSRLLWRMRSFGELADQKIIWRTAATFLPKGRSYEWNQALMDLGATICTARAPRCNECRVESLCASSRSMVRPATRQRRREPSFNGMPNRIYRGRIIELLRRRNGRGPMNVAQLRKELLGKSGKRSERWLHLVLSSLQRDGLVNLKGEGTRSARVALA